MVAVFCQEAFGDIDHGEQSCQVVREALERFYESAREAFETVLVGDRIGRRVVLELPCLCLLRPVCHGGIQRGCNSLPGGIL